MSMHFYPIYGYFLDMDVLMDKVGLKEEWDEMDIDPSSVEEDLEGSEIDGRLRELFPKGFEILYTSTEDDVSCSELEPIKFYVVLVTSDLYDCTPNKALVNLQNMGLEPQQDAFVRFG